ncbi:MAG TPA: hypothetical protein PLB89_16780 [Flavobacteriales bacterium]|nr:hypothetical protein [Flavobacteriales bacterium]
MERLKRITPIVLGIACFGLVWDRVQAPREAQQGVRITLTATTSMSDTYQVFYDTVGHGYGAEWSSSVAVQPSLHQQEITFAFPAMERLHGIRMDAGDRRTTILLHAVRFDGPYRSLTWNADDIAKHFTVLHDVDTLHTIPGENTVVIHCTERDPFLTTKEDLAPLLRSVLDTTRPVLAPFVLACLSGIACAILVSLLSRIRWRSMARSRWMTNIPIIGSTIAILAAMAIFYFTRALLDQITFVEYPTDLVVSGSFPQDDDVQIYYSEKPDGFTRNAYVANSIAGNPQAQLVKLRVPSGADLHYLRFDPGMFQDTLWLDSLTINVGRSSITWPADELKERLVPNGHVAKVEIQDGRLRVITQGNDPFFTIHEDLAPILAAQRARNGNGPMPVLIAAICALFFLLGSARSLSRWTGAPGTSWTDRCIIICFLLVLAAPMISGITGVEPRLSNTEKRVLAERPGFTISRTLTYPAEFTTYYEENFALRQLLFRWNSLFIAKALNTSPLPERTLFGKDGWMFYMREDAIPRYEGICTMTEDQLTTIALRLEQRRQWLAAQGIDYILMVPPEKSAIYPDKLPSRIERLDRPSCLDRLIDLAAERTKLRIVDVRKELKDARAMGDVYYTTDTHWNPVGAWFGYAALIQAIREKRPEVVPAVPYSGYDLHVDTNDQGDLGTLIGLNDVFTRVTPLLVPHDSLTAEDATPGSYANSGFLKYPPVVKEVKGSKAPRLLMFRDSFMVYMIPSVSEHFSRSAYVWTPVFIPQIVAEEHPDVVVHEVMEFYLSDLLQDDLPLPALPGTP